MQLKFITLIILLKGDSIWCRYSDEDDEGFIPIGEGSSIPIEEESSKSAEDDGAFPIEKGEYANNPSENGNTEADKISRLGVEDVLGSEVHFDEDDSDIEDYDFGEHELDEEEDIDITANNIKPADWFPILENYIMVLKEKIQKVNELMILEKKLKERKKDDFEDEEDDKSTCASLEYIVLTDINSLPVEKQKIVLDIDKDGIPDFDFVQLNDDVDQNNSEI